jgi:NAD(P)-dependent dehydrogenase (short-subunit alcohol dehydrogenase family)
VTLANRHAVVTGGAGEIGLAIARRLSEKGAAVTILDKKISPEGSKRRRETRLSLRRVGRERSNIRD